MVGTDEVVAARLGYAIRVHRLRRVEHGPDFDWYISECGIGGKSMRDAYPDDKPLCPTCFPAMIRSNRILR